MQRPAILLSLIASLSLVLSPLGMLHAHVDSDHDHVLVHGGHTHNLDQHEAHHDGHGGDQWASEHGDTSLGVFNSPATATVVQLDVDANDQVSQNPIKFIAKPCDRPPDLLNPVTIIKLFPECEYTFTLYRPYLHPPLRGPPAVIP